MGRHWRHPQEPSTHPLLDWLIAAVAIVAIICGVLLGFSMLAATKAKAHSFYPADCCSGFDCGVLKLERVEFVLHGYLIDGIYFVHDSSARVSPDKNFHGCLPPSGGLRCFWAPKPSM